MRKASLGWLCAALGLAGAAAPARAQTFAGTAEVVEVEVPVQIVRDGQPLRGLTAADFELYDGRKKQAITGFRVVDLAAAPSGAALPVAGRRQFLLLFDLAFSDPKAVVQAREAARGLVLKGIRAGDLVGVATYSAARGPQLVLGFTSDRRQVDAALDSLGLVRAPANDPLRLMMAGAAAGTGDQRLLAEGSQEADAAHADALLHDLGPEQANLGRESNRSAQATAVTALTRSFSGFAHTLAAIPGRKQILYFSEGFDSSLLTGSGASPQAGGDSVAAGGLDPTATVDRGVGSSEPILGSTDESFGSTKSVNEVERLLEELRRADCVVQAVDIGGLRAAGEQRVTRTGGKDSLFTLARGTDGELFESSNDLSAAMRGVLERTSLTYVLAFQPESAKPDGAYHKLRVELKNAPRGVRLSYRPGYYSPRPYAALNPMEKLFEASSRVMGGVESGAIASAVLAAPFRTAAGRAYVPVLIEVDGPGLLAGKPAAGPLPVEIYVYALDAGGAIQDYLVQSLGMDLAKVEPALRQSGLKFFGHLDLPAGDYSVRTLVRNGATGAFSLRVAPLTVPAFAAAPVLLPPFFPEPPNRWLLSRETPRGPQAAYPFMAGQQPYIPAARPALAAGQEVPVSLVGYNLGAGELKAEGRILDHNGKAVGAGEVRVLAREGAAGGGPDRLKAAFKPPPLPPGEYVLQVTLSGAGGAAGTSSAPFVVSAGR